MFGKSGNDDWKSKYDELRRELLEQERQWGEVEALLQRAVTRVSIAAAGQDERMEGPLDGIRGAVKGKLNRVQLERGLADLAEVVKRLEAEASAKPGAAATREGDTGATTALLLETLRRLQVDGDDRAALTDLIDYVTRNPERGEDISRRAGSFLNKCLTLEAAKPGKPVADNKADTAADRSTLASVLSRLGLSAPARTKVIDAWSPPRIDSLLEELATQLKPLLTEVAAAAPGVAQHDSPVPTSVPESAPTIAPTFALRVDTSAPAAAADRLLPLLATLARRMSAIAGMERVGEELQQRLQQPIGEAEWPVIIESLADAMSNVVATIRAQKAELESFITQVSQQLGEFEKFVVTNQQDLDSARSGRQLLSNRLGDEMQSIRARMDDATNLVDLKRSVVASLNNIADQITSFRDNEESRISAAEERNHQLIRQMDELRFEARRLREQNEEQREQLMLDALTKVHSRYAYEKRVVEEFSRWQRYKQPLSYVIWDIDRFKSINDTYGHKVGDKLLKLVARLLARNTRKSDFLARLGGEEFVMLLPGTKAEDAAVIANKLRLVIADTDFHYNKNPRTITLSCGITEFRDGDTVDVVYQRADAALYQAKNAGRNRCEAA
ncbi:MAG: diguanylate cyclase [Gammaproteobacteria bacterium]|nr:diguanylate cyclase [Gammaproteobacteria bacterium]